MAEMVRQMDARIREMEGEMRAMSQRMNAMRTALAAEPAPATTGESWGG
jgi:hypothetical protein